MQRVAGRPHARVIHQKPEQNLVVGRRIVKFAAAKLCRRQGNLVLRRAVGDSHHTLRGLLDRWCRRIPSQQHVALGRRGMQCQRRPAWLVFECPDFMTRRSRDGGQSAQPQQRPATRTSRRGRRLVFLNPRTARGGQWQHGDCGLGRFDGLLTQRFGRRLRVCPSPRTSSRLTLRLQLRRFEQELLVRPLACEFPFAPELKLREAFLSGNGLHQEQDKMPYPGTGNAAVPCLPDRARCLLRCNCGTNQSPCQTLPVEAGPVAH